MYDYDYVKPKYKEKAELFYMNRDSLKAHEKSQIYADLAMESKCNYPQKKKR